MRVHEPRPGARLGRRAYEPFVRFSYAVNGVPYEARRLRAGALWFASPRDAIARAERYPEGAGRTCRYDPRDPARAVLETPVSVPTVAGLLIAAATLFAAAAMVAAHTA